MINKEKILAYALDNAILHKGKANINSVLNKLFMEGMKKEQLKEILPKVKETVERVNALSFEEQKKQFASLSRLVKKFVPRIGLPELPKKEKVIMRFAPFPSGPLHIGNARIAIINDEYCKKYNGKFLLVIDDTMGSEEKRIEKEAYKLILEGLDWLRVKYENPIYKSDRLEIYYKWAEEMIKKNAAYVCKCSTAELRKNREQMKECECRKASVEKNIEMWKKMLSKKIKEGKAVLRIKTSMQHPNPAFRDRVLFRICNRIHPRTGKKYIVWPLLEFSWAIDDHLLGITHIIRGTELTMETEMEKTIWKIFDWKEPEIIHIGLLQIEGAKISKTKSRKEIKEKKYIGWEDPRTWSLQSLKKRGIRAEALRKFCLSFGLSETNIIVPIEMLYAENRKIIESCNRYFFIESPKKIICNSPAMTAKIPFHPNFKERGYKKISTKNEFFIAKSDFEKMKKEKKGNYRLMYLFNFRKEKKFEFLSREVEKELRAKPLHWLPADKENSKKLVKTEILMPNGKIVRGLAEEEIKNLKVDDVIQFERFGFCRLDKKNKIYKFWFAHK